MGGIARSLFGGSKQSSNSTSTSQNQAFPYLQEAFSPSVATGNQASNALANLLGLNGAPAQTQGFDNWRNSTGYNFGLNQGLGAITGGAATKGLLNSGATAKALTQYGQDYASTKYGDYLNQLQSLIGSGLSAGGLIGNAGQTSTSTSASKGSSTNGGFGGVVGTLLGK